MITTGAGDGVDGQAGPDPRAATTPREFVVEMRRRRAWSGLTFRQLESRAAAAGDVLPNSTLGTVLHRSTLPREELLAAFIRACGGSPEEVELWCAVRKRLAAEEVAKPSGEREVPHDEPAEPEKETTSRRVRKMAVLLAFVLVAGMVIAGVAVWETPRSSPVKAAAPEGRPDPRLAASKTGFHLVRSVRTGLCLSARRGVDGLIVLVACDSAFPQRRVERQTDGSDRILTDHPTLGRGCMGVRRKEVHDDFCGAKGANETEQFWLEPVKNRPGAYRIRVALGDRCLGVSGPVEPRRTPVALLPCALLSPDQDFAFDPDPRQG